MIRFYKNPSFFKWVYPDRVWDIKSDSSIFLTFDDGPDPEVTPWVMEELNRVGAKATFFCVGQNIQAHRAIAKKLVTEKHLVSNHGFSHLNGQQTFDDDYVEDVEKCDLVLDELKVTNRLFRPPYGRIKKNQAIKLNKQIVMWSHLSWDFDPACNLDRSLKSLIKAKTGSILTFHDSKKAFENLRILLPYTLNYFHERGIKFRTLPHD